MAELSLRDRLQPSLLDRLTDHAPTRLNVLVSFAPAPLEAAGIGEADVRGVLREAHLKLLEEQRQDADGRLTLVLQAPEPFMPASAFGALLVGDSARSLGEVVDISFRRVRRSSESREERFLSMQRLKESVLRDLNWLLNTGNLENLSDAAAISDYPEVLRSVVNYGIPDITGMFARGASVALLERVMTDAIRRFEPRILAHSLAVRAVLDSEQMNRRTLSFLIEGQLWGQPLPEQLYLETELDLGSGQVAVREVDGGPVP